MSDEIWYEVQATRKVRFMDGPDHGPDVAHASEPCVLRFATGSGRWSETYRKAEPSTPKEPEPIYPGQVWRHCGVYFEVLLAANGMVTLRSLDERATCCHPVEFFREHFGRRPFHREA